MRIITEVNLLKKRRTKIIATIGPSTNDPKIIKNLITAGADIFRLNMSHGNHEIHRQTYLDIRKTALNLDRPIGILFDLCGPKIRTGKFKNEEIKLIEGRQVIVTTRDVEGNRELIPSRYRALADDVKPGNRILLDDGNMELEVRHTGGTEIHCIVIHGGTLKNHKGINLPGVHISAPSLTEKDKEDAQFAMELGADFLALSFVRKAADIQDLKNLIAANSGSTAIIAKIEKPEALDDADAILDISDGIMVARGDLGVELNPEQVPVAQHQLIDRARSKFKPVIVATQMLESMIENAYPTRAEVADVANAVTLGTDAIMLSGETAVGAYPVDAVSMMDRIARQTESYLWEQNIYGGKPQKTHKDAIPVWQAVANAMARLAYDLRVQAVVVISQSGMSAATMSAARPAAPVIVITDSPEVCRKISLLWGVIPVQKENAGKSDPNQLACYTACEQGLARPNETILLVRGFHSDPKLNAPSVTVVTI